MHSLTGKSNHNGLLLGAVILATSAVVGYSLPSPDKQANQLETKGTLHVTPSALELGTVWANEAYRHALPIRNDGQVEITIMEIQPDCSCPALLAQNLPLVIPSGETRNLEVRIDLLSRLPLDSIKTQHAVSILFAVLTAELPPQWIELNADVKRALWFTPTEIDFADSLTSGLNFVEAFADLEELTDLADVRVECDPAIGRARVRRDAKTRGRWKLAFSPDPDLAVGPFNADIRVIGVAANGGELSALNLPVRGTVMADARAIPSSLQFGARACNEQAEVQFIVKTASGRKFTIEGAALSDAKRGGLSANFKVPTDQLTSEATVAASVTPVQSGRLKAEAIVHLSFPDGDTGQVVVPLSIYGVNTADPSP